MRTIYFLGSGVCSITQMMANGRTVDIATVGNEGCVGISAMFGRNRALGGALVLTPGGTAQVMTLKAFRREMDRRGPFRNVMNRYAEVFVASLIHSVACNALHTVEQRCARWLLTMHDRVGQGEFQMTQESLAMALGVRRPTITLVAGTLQRAGIVQYGQRRILILDRAELTAISCECYTLIAEQFTRLLS
jgi:CRP-like cAMP-binding protein